LRKNRDCYIFDSLKSRSLSCNKPSLESRHRRKPVSELEKKLKKMLKGTRKRGKRPLPLLKRKEKKSEHKLKRIWQLQRRDIQPPKLPNKKLQIRKQQL